MSNINKYEISNIDLKQVLANDNEFELIEYGEDGKEIEDSVLIRKYVGDAVYLVYDELFGNDIIEGTDKMIKYIKCFERRK